MSYIVRSGNLARTPDLTTTEDGHLKATATVIVNDTAKNADGQWETTATTAYRVHVRGRTAQRLTEAAQRNGNIAVVFAGDYRIRTYTATDGTSRLSHDVYADHIGADLATQDINIIKTAPTPRSAVDAAESADAQEDLTPYDHDHTDNPF